MKGNLKKFVGNHTSYAPTTIIEEVDKQRLYKRLALSFAQ